MKVLAAALLACLLAQGTALARKPREHHTDPKAYLTRANRLAGEGKCAEAVKDFTKAYEKLHDPVVLFNRAECYRRIGENAKAAEDYRGFLKGFPAAPNRADIEAKIATLEKPAAPPPATRPPPGPARTPPAPTQATAPPPPGRARPTPPPPPVAAPPPPAARPPVATAPAPAAPAEAGPMPFLPPPPGADGEPSGLIEAPRAAPEEKPKAQAEKGGSRWWLWTALGVIAVGGGVAGYIYFRPKETPIPDSALGNYRF